MEEILHQLATVSLYIYMKDCKLWDYEGINHIPTGAGFLPSTVGSDMMETSVNWIYKGKTITREWEHPPHPNLIFSGPGWEGGPCDEMCIGACASSDQAHSEVQVSGDGVSQEFLGGFTWCFRRAVQNPIEVVSCIKTIPPLYHISRSIKQNQ
jgi:hypothetical protein